VANRCSLPSWRSPTRKPGNADLSQGTIAIEATTLVPTVAKWLLCIQT
jgi:hypothetical protein